MVGKALDALRRQGRRRALHRSGPRLWHDHLGRAPHDDHAYFLGWPSLGAWLHEVAEAMEHHDQADRLDAVTHPTVHKDGYYLDR